MAFNLVVLSGRLTADAELKTTMSGVSVTNFSIAVDRRTKSGEEKQTDFISIVAWGQTAEFICKYFRKGSMIGIEGAIQTRKYQDKDGNNRTAFEVVAYNVQFMEGKKAETSADPLPDFAQKVADAGFTEVSGDDDLPF